MKCRAWAWPATLSRSPTATAVTIWCRAARRSPGRKGAEKQVSQIKRARDAREIRDLGHAREIKADSRSCRSSCRAGRRGRPAVRLGHRERLRRGREGRRRSVARPQARAAARPHQDHRATHGNRRPAPDVLAVVPVAVVAGLRSRHRNYIPTGSTGSACAHMPVRPRWRLCRTPFRVPTRRPGPRIVSATISYPQADGRRQPVSLGPAIFAPAPYTQLSTSAQQAVNTATACHPHAVPRGRPQAALRAVQPRP